MKNFAGIEIVLGAEAVASRTRAVGRIETERAWLENGHADAAVGASEFFGKNVFFAAHDGNRDETAGELKGRGNGLFEARSDALLDKKTIHDDFDGVILALIKRGKIVHRVKFAVDANADIAILAEFFEFLAIGTFAAAHDRCEDHDAIVGLGKLPLQDGLNNCLAGLPGDGLAAIGAVRHANGGVNNAKIIVNFRDGADGGTR